LGVRAATEYPPGVIEADFGADAQRWFDEREW
jgi:hypothetical protein